MSEITPPIATVVLSIGALLGAIVGIQMGSVGAALICAAFGASTFGFTAMSIMVVAADVREKRVDLTMTCIVGGACAWFTYTIYVLLAP